MTHWAESHQSWHAWKAENYTRPWFSIEKPNWHCIYRPYCVGALLHCEWKFGTHLSFTQCLSGVELYWLLQTYAPHGRGVGPQSHKHFTWPADAVQYTGYIYTCCIHNALLSHWRGYRYRSLWCTSLFWTGCRPVVLPTWLHSRLWQIDNMVIPFPPTPRNIKG